MWVPRRARQPYYSLESAVGFVGKNGREVATGVRFVGQAPQSSPHAFVSAADREAIGRGLP